MNKSKMENNYCYRLMNDTQLQDIYKGILRRLEVGYSVGMEKELKLVKAVAVERELQLGNKRDTVQGFIKFWLKGKTTKNKNEKRDNL